MKQVVVNEQDEVLGYVDRTERKDGQITRVSALWLFNEKGETLIAQRALDKVYDPGKWSLSVAGTVEEGETYVTNILKETEEELGVRIQETDLIPLARRLVRTMHSYFCQVFYARIPSHTSITPQEGEVVGIRWVSKQKLRAWFTRSPEEFVESFGRYLEEMERTTLAR